jgi:hypothetical protein
MYCASVTSAVGICLRRDGMDAHSCSANPDPMMNSRWIVVACFLTFGCAQPKPETVDQPAKLISGSCSHPEYPAEAARAGQTGDVSVKFLVDSKGDVTSTTIEKSTGFSILDDITAPEKCRYRSYGPIVVGENFDGTPSNTVRFVLGMKGRVCSRFLVPTPFLIQVG